MKLVIQRVKKAQVFASCESVGKIGQGLFILMGVGQEDKLEHADVLAEKVVNLRIMSDHEDKMNLSIKDVGGEVLVVSQFTLYADTTYGRRPSFIQAAKPEVAKEIYKKFVEKIEEQGVKVSTGSFGNYMEIENIADGPVTIILKYPEEKEVG